MLSRAGAASSLRLGASYEKAIDDVAKDYVKFCTALGFDVPQFDVATLCAFNVDYVAYGNTARSLPGRMTRLRKFASRVRAAFPPLRSSDWKEVKEGMDALMKIDPTRPSRATIMSARRCKLVMKAMGIHCFSDLFRCTLFHLQLAARMMICHTACLRGCEHRDGMKQRDVVEATDEYVLIKVAARSSAKKIKHRPARIVALPVYPSLSSAGAIFTVYINAVFNGSVDHNCNGPLFPLIRPGGRVQDIVYDTPTSDKEFIKLVRQYARRTSMHDNDVSRITSHSFRAGGASDLAAGGASDEQIKHQGGWTSLCFRIYIRLDPHHVRSMTTHLQRALLAASTASS